MRHAKTFYTVTYGPHVARFSSNRDAMKKAAEMNLAHQREHAN